MKKSIKTLIIAMFIAFPVFLFAQNPPHPNGGNDPGGSNTPVGGGAPIGSGLIFMMALGFGYASKRIYNLRNNILD